MSRPKIYFARDRPELAKAVFQFVLRSIERRHIAVHALIGLLRSISLCHSERH